MSRKALLVVLGLVVLPLTSWAVDARFLRMWESAQDQRPTHLASSARIASEAEPGTPMVVRGLILLPDGRPAAGTVVFAYHTDRGGVYAPPGEMWRLKGWAVADKDGHFTFTTIRPGSYPSGGVPAHIHLSLETSCCGRQFDELMFEGDPLLTPEYRSRFAAAGEQAVYAPVRTERGVEQVEYTLQIRPRGDF
jgi:protocatechuate 3,4-dioxygenase beta subunit